jgi:flavin reductase (DIM6/NTAB) family NADH-FMN oxidoreductase RutF
MLTVEKSAVPMNATQERAIAEELKTAFRFHPAGVAVITADEGGRPVGLTASSVVSVSVEPPALMFSMVNKGSVAAAVLDVPSLLVHLLDSSNVELARLFATPGADKFRAETKWTRLETGEPWLTDAPVALRCRPIALTPIGGSTVVVAEVMEVLAAEDRGDPLVYFHRGYYRLAPENILELP